MEKSVEIELKSWEIKADFLEIKLGNQPNPPAPPTFTTYDIIFEGNHGEIKEKSGNLVRQNCLLPTPRFRHIAASQPIKWLSSDSWYMVLASPVPRQLTRDAGSSCQSSSVVLIQCFHSLPWLDWIIGAGLISPWQSTNGMSPSSLLTILFVAF